MEKSNKLKGHDLLLYPPMACITLIVVLMMLFSVFVRGFASPFNFSAILTQITYIGIVALGLNFVILLGEIDVTVAIDMVLCAYMFTFVVMLTDSILIGVLGAVATGAVFGLLNGLLVGKLQLSSFIATTATKFSIRALMLYFLGGNAYPNINKDTMPERVYNIAKMINSGTVKLPSEQRFLGLGTIFGIRTSVYIFVLLFLVILMIVKHTNWGRNVFALGGNRRAAVVAGIPMDRTVVLAYVVCGICCGVSGVIYMCQTGTMQAGAAQGSEMLMIAACAIGGTAMAGGRGSGVSPFVGAILIGIIMNVISVLAIPGVWQDFFIGAIVLVSACFDVVRRKVVDKAYE